MAGTGQDVTELRRIQEGSARLRAEEREWGRLRTILEQLPAGVMIADAAGSIAYANPTATKIFGGEIPSPGTAGDYERTFKAFTEDGEPLSSDAFPWCAACAARPSSRRWCSSSGPTRAAPSCARAPVRCAILRVPSPAR